MFAKVTEAEVLPAPVRRELAADAAVEFGVLRHVARRELSLRLGREAPQVNTRRSRNDTKRPMSIFGDEN